MSLRSSKLSKQKLLKLLRDLNYLNTDEIRFC
jgi:hypothetical protein